MLCAGLDYTICTLPNVKISIVHRIFASTQGHLKLHKGSSSQAGSWATKCKHKHMKKFLLISNLHDWTYREKEQQDSVTNDAHIPNVGDPFTRHGISGFFLA